MTSELAVKVDRVREVLLARDLSAVILTSKESLAWLLGGARVTVPTNGDPVLSARVTEHELTLYVYANEVDRLREEELYPLGELDIRSHPWHEPLPGVAPMEGAAPEASIAAELRAARAGLLPVELERYRTLGHDVAAAVTAVASELRPTDSERHAAAALAHAIVETGAEPIVLLAAGRERLQLRHPLPTNGHLGSRAMLVVGARRNGLIANLTRFVGDAADGDSDERLLAVEADAFAATRVGRKLSKVLADIAASYPAHGFDDDEWLRHHQGGPTGYAGRDPRATPAASDRVVDGQAFAWNPSAPGTKVEDTVLVAAGEIEVLTVDPAWPTADVGGIRRPIARAYS
ncbi:M24 family metallopeptidase [Gryllotalpicola daejeonensis]|uniref:M24 family metallopeptidase n=1 Tax=Gryllotalpicola daejeonensis TaxID=993087 RepID=A0ABP7ZI08_9MICO